MIWQLVYAHPNMSSAIIRIILMDVSSTCMQDQVTNEDMADIDDITVRS